MLNIWNKLYSTEFEIIKFSKNFYVYPIFKNGSTSLTVYAKKNNLLTLNYNEIKDLEEITVYFREPLERFVSGVHTFFYFNKLKLNNENLQKIYKFKLLDRHFMPQSFWLCNLFKYYKNKIILKDFNELHKIIPIKEGPWRSNPGAWIPLTKNQKEKIKSIDHKKFIDVDYKVLSKYINQKIYLPIITKEIKNVLSSY